MDLNRHSARARGISFIVNGKGDRRPARRKPDQPEGGYPSGFRPKEMTENRIRLPRIGYEYRAVVSPDGKAAYSYEDAIVLLKFKSGEADYYVPPAAMFTFMPQGFPDEETLLVFVRNKKAQSSWLVKTGGDQ